MKKIVSRLSLALALVLGVGMVLAPMAVAGPPVQSCKAVSGTATLSPGLTTTPKNNTIVSKGTLTGCTSAATTGGSGVLSSTIKVTNGSCAKLATGKQTLTAAGTITWKNKKASKVALTLKTGTGSSATVATITGKVSSGLFAAHKIGGQIKFTVKAGQDCTAAHPIRNLTFKSTKPFVIS